MLALWQIAREKQADSLADELLASIEKQTLRLQQESAFGYWGSRCELLLERAREIGALGGELAGAVRATGAPCIRKGQIAECLEAYRRAANAAVRGWKTEIGFNLGYTLRLDPIEGGRL